MNLYPIIVNTGGYKTPFLDGDGNVVCVDLDTAPTPSQLRVWASGMVTAENYQDLPTDWMRGYSSDDARATVFTFVHDYNGYAYTYVKGVNKQQGSNQLCYWSISGSQTMKLTIMEVGGVYKLRWHIIIRFYSADNGYYYSYAYLDVPTASSSPYGEYTIYKTTHSSGPEFLTTAPTSISVAAP